MEAQVSTGPELRGGLLLKREYFYFSALILLSALQVQCATKNTSVVDSQRSSTNKPRASKSLSYLHFIMGELSAADNNSKAALEHYRYASHFDPESETLLLSQSEQLLNLDRIDEAKKVIEILPTQENADFHMLRSRIATIEFDLDKAVNGLQKAEAIFEKEGNTRKVRETLLTRVALLSDYRKYDEALGALDTYLRIHSYDEIAHYFQGKIYSIQRENEKAKDAFKRAIELRPGFVAAIKALGLRLELEGKIEEAIANYQQAYPHASQDKTIVQKLANLNLIRENYPAALEYLKQLITLDPGDTVSQLRTGLLYYKLKQYKEAKELFETILKNDQVAHDRVYFYLANMYDDKGDYQNASQNYLKVPAESDYFIESRLQLSDLYLEKLNNKEKAVTSLHQAIELKPESRELYISLADIFEKKNELKEAILVLDRAKKHLPSDERIIFILGSLLDKAGDYQAGIKTMEEVLTLNPNNAYALNHIGYVLTEKRFDLERAETLLRKAIQLAPDNGHILDSMGWLYFQKKDFKKAKHFLERAVNITDNEPVILEHLADTYQKMGLNKQALEIYRKVMRLSAREEKKPEIDDAFQKRLRDKIASLDADDSLQ